ncbi:MAG: NAD(P)-dependent oxidoreductase [Terrimicrobiaceae bacterium]
MNVLITGATGFVGRNLLLRAVDRGQKVYAPVRDESKLLAQLQAEGLETSQVKALPANPAQWPTRLPIDTAIHCAGALFERSLEPYLKTNVAWTKAVLANLPSGCPAIILSSQSAGGPTPEGKMSREESDADEPISDYGESKLRMERMILRSGRSRMVVLRPPMILGPRDSAVLQLFQMARGPVRTKPGFQKKTYSFLAVGDLLNAIDASIEAHDSLSARCYYVASKQQFSDLTLLNEAARCLRSKGINLPLPQALVQAASTVVDASPSLRLKLPSLTRDRVREILADRWVVNPSLFEAATGWTAKSSLRESLSEAHRHYQSVGLLS